MRIIRRLLQRIFPPPPIIIDPVFGQLTDADTHYEGHCYFEPTGNQVELGIVKKKGGPDAKQHAFFRRLEQSYDKLVPTFQLAIEQDLGEWIPGSNILDFKNEIQLEYIWIPDCEQLPPEWEITFFATNELQHSLTLAMKGTMVVYVIMDG